MKKYVIFTIFLIITAVLCGCDKKQQQPMDLYDLVQNRGKIIVGVKADTKPFGFLNKENQYEGFDVDLAKRIAKSIFNDENAVEFISVTPSNKIMLLNSGQADIIIAAMTITSQRSAVVDFSIPYYYAGQTLLLKKDSKIKSLSDPDLKKIGILFGTIAEKMIRIAAPNALISGYRTYADAVSALKEDKIDAVATDDTIVLGIVMDDDSLKMLDAPRYSKEPYGIAFRKGEESKRLKTIINDVITDMNNDGSLNSLTKKWTK